MDNSRWERPAVALDREAEQQALQRQGVLTKPPGSLGQLEAVAVRLAAMQGQIFPQIRQPWITVFAADHGIAEAGVSAFPQAVTAEMVRNFSRGGAAISVLARHLQAPLEVVNVGTVNPLEVLDGVVDARVADGSANFLNGAALTSEQCSQALEAGAAAVARALAERADLYIGGEMGIANTTAAAAMVAALLGLSGVEVAGAGTGLDRQGINHKAVGSQQALDHHQDQLVTPPDILQRLGGLEIAALVGAYISAAQQGLPLLVDGFISSAAALCAVRINPSVRGWLLFSHRSAEQGHMRVLEALEADPLLDLGMRLGEGSGAAVATSLLQQACWLHGEMATFAEAGVSGK